MALRFRSAVAVLLGLGVVSALGADPGLVGSTAADYLKLGSGARAAALGEAVTADPSGLSDQAYNPAGLSQADANGGGIEFCHTAWFQDARVEALAARFSLGGWGAMGLSYSELGLPSQDQTVLTGNGSDPSNNFSVLGSFSPSDTVTSLGYAYAIDQRLSLGASLMSADESLAGNLAQGFGFDLGLLYRAPLADGSTLSFGLADLDQGYTRYADGERVSWPQATDVGLAYHSGGRSTLHGTVMLDYDLPSDNQPALGIGAELALGGTFTARFGYRVDGIFNPWSLGLGVKALKALNLDLAVVPAGTLGTTYRAAVAYQWSGAPGGAPVAVSRPPAVLLAVKQSAFDPADGLGKGRLRPVLPPGTLCKAWGLYIYGGKRVVRTIQATGQPPYEIDWDGKLDDGSNASPGIYPARLALVLLDRSVQYSDGYISFQVYQAFPTLSLAWDHRSVLKDTKAKAVPAILDVASSAVDPNLAWRLVVLDPDGKPFRTFNGDLSPTSEVVWDGKSDDGRDFYSNYHYEFKLGLMDKLGNELKAEDSLKARMVFDR
ncbi:MAG TPA: PorV/PorQ family protein [bacterium]|nr:PorV/PorQ family protein [bacterium]